MAIGMAIGLAWVGPWLLRKPIRAGVGSGASEALGMVQAGSLARRAANTAR
jgi:hypothetical protein